MRGKKELALASFLRFSPLCARGIFTGIFVWFVVALFVS